MNNAELREALDDFGDHLPVAVVLNEGENDERTVEVTGAEYGSLPNGDAAIIISTTA